MLMNNRKEQILLATLELATQYGLNAISMSQIAQKVGIQKPSLYNHFKSKDEIISSIYEYIRDNAQKNATSDNADIGEFIKSNSAVTVLTYAVTNYLNMSKDDKLFSFYKVIYAERAINADAAKIMAEETKRMINATKNIFYALQVHGKINVKDIDTAAFSFAMSIHSIMDYQFDCEAAQIAFDENIMQNYIKWFCENIGA